MLIRKSEKVAMQELKARFEPKTLDEENRTIEVVFSTGARVKRFSWLDGVYEEELSLKRGQVRLDRLNAGAAVLNNHRANSLADVIGVVEKASIRKAEGGATEAVATLRFSERADVEPIFRDVKSGIIRNISVGYRVHKYEETREGEGADAKRVLRATDWEPMEVSFVTIPADAGAQVRSESKEYVCEVILNRGEDEMALDPKQPTVAPDTRQAEIETAKAEAAKAAVDAERARVAEIATACRSAKLSDDFRDKLIASGATPDEARKQILGELSRADKAAPTTSTNVEVVSEARDHVKGGAVNAILHRYDPSKYKLDDNGKRFRGLSMRDLAVECLETAGVKTRGMSATQLWETSMGLNRSGMHTSSDFPEILANTANKTLRDAYAEAPQTFLPFTREVEVPDFKQISRAQLGDAPNLLKVPEHGEVTRGSIGEGAEKYNVETYERIVAVTRKVIINDDLEAFTRVPALMGRAARDLESDLVWGEITANPVMGDGVALFHATHGNLAGSGAVISVTTIGAGRTAMRKQKGLNGRLLNISPMWLVVPAELETSAEQFTGPINPETAANANPFSGRLKVVAEPRLQSLSGGSATAWFLFAGTGQIDMIEMAKLSGMREPSISTRQGWDVEGMEIKVLLDVGVKAIDYRGLYKNAGA